MNSSTRSVLAFGPFRLIPEQRLLLRADAPLRLGSRAREILFALVDRAGELVKKSELIAHVWHGVAVEEGTLRVHISALRKALGDVEYVQNVNGLGYRFVGRIEHLTEATPPVPAVTPSVTPSGCTPAAITRMIGRDDIVPAVAERLRDKRLLTLVGAGGIGKTTVANAAMEQLLANYPDGAHFVDFSAVTDPLLVPATVASRLGIAATTQGPLLDSLEALANKRLLLVLDNCEHVIEAVTPLTETLLAGAPEMNILATSREPLRASGEGVLRLPPLSVPPPSQSLTAREAMSFSAVQLFVERAKARQYTFSIDDANAAEVADICRRLDGLPLAIELAAAHVGLFGMRGLVAHQDNLLDLLTQGRRSALPRQQTLRATLDWSFNLLSDTERTALRKLSVFSTAFDFAAARAVVADEQIGAADVLDIVTNLTAKSLIVADSDDGLFRMFETTRSYAQEQAVKSRAS